MSRLSIIMCGSILGCGGPIPVYLVSSDGQEAPVLDPTERVRDALDEGFAYWGRAYELIGDRPLRTHGSLLIHMVEVEMDEPTHGATIQPSHCYKTLWADTAYPKVLGHELGHVWLGAEHDDDPDNIMHSSTLGDDITEAQYEEAQEAIDRFLLCAG